MSLNTKLFCVILRGNPDATLIEPRMLRLGSWLFSLIPPSATPTSDHLNGVIASVRVLVRTYATRAWFSQLLVRAYVCSIEKTLKPESLGLGKPGMLPNAFRPFPGKVTVSLSFERKSRPANRLLAETS